MVEVIRGALPDDITDGLSGDGSGYGDGYGSGYGDGSGDGSGDGDGYGSGDGDGDGYGDGYGSGDGDGDGYGYGYGYGDGYGYGYGSGDGDGYGYGSGYGDGSGDWSGALAVARAVVSTKDYLTDPRTLALWKSDAHGKPANGGFYDEAARPGLRQTVPGPLKLCENGTLHATLMPGKWKGERLWLVALEGEVVGNAEKMGALTREILGEIPLKRFCVIPPK